MAVNHRQRYRGSGAEVWPNQFPDFICTCTCVFIYLFIHVLVYLFMYSFTYLFMYTYAITAARQPRSYHKTTGLWTMDIFNTYWPFAPRICTISDDP